MNDRFAWNMQIKPKPKPNLNSNTWTNQFHLNLANQFWKSLLMFLHSLVASLQNGFKVKTKKL